MNTNKGTILGMKSHDCHVLLQRLLPVAIRGYFNDNIRTTLTKLCLFFKDFVFTNIEVRCLKSNEGRHCCDFMQNGNDISSYFF